MKLIIANWKSNPGSLGAAIKLARESDYSGIVIAAPHIFLEEIGKRLKRAVLAAQDVFWAKSGPYTGEVSLKQLKGLGVKYVILGHSERRRELKETDKLINKKVKAALKANLKVILCVGEWRRTSLPAAKSFVKGELKRDLAKVRSYKNLIVAYEPVWAISTEKYGKADTPENAVMMSLFIKSIVPVKKVIYGGSVKSSNAKKFLEQKEIAGALVGGASLKPKEFRKIIKSLNK